MQAKSWHGTRSDGTSHEKLKKPDPRRKIRSAAPEMEKSVEGREKGVKKMKRREKKRERGESA